MSNTGTSNAPTRVDLDRVLRGVSRSFWLTLRVLPPAVRGPLGLAYLFCRAADTIADTRLLDPAERLEHLLRFRRQFESEAPDTAEIETIASRLGAPGAVAEEAELLAGLQTIFARLEQLPSSDRDLIRRLVQTLTRGMEHDLTWFPAEESGRVRALESDEQLDTYCYHVAGCVGEFWTDLCKSKLPALGAWDGQQFRALGVRFGKGLQMTNILRDVDADLRIGRSYLPAPGLEALGLDLRRWVEGDDRSAVRPLVHRLLGETLEHYRAGWQYTLAIPRRLPRLRLACAWPLLIGLETLTLIARADDPCAPGVRHKISRPAVRRTMRRSSLRVLSNGALDGLWRELEGRLVDALERA